MHTRTAIEIARQMTGAEFEVQPVDPPVGAKRPREPAVAPLLEISCTGIGAVAPAGGRRS